MGAVRPLALLALLSFWLHEVESNRRFFISSPDANNSHWPLSKMTKMVEEVEKSGRVVPKGMAVILTTGAMNPIHLGHVQMLHQAQARLEKDGYAVVGAWLSPSHDMYVLPKADDKETFGLTAKYRIELASHAVSDDPLVSISDWEASQLEGQKRTDVSKALQDYLRSQGAFKNLQRKSGHVRTFYVCGTDHAETTNIYNGLQKFRDLGAVVVPRTGDKLGKERPDKLVYVADASPGEVAALSSTKVRQAVETSDIDFVKKAVGEDATRFLLSPTAEEFDQYAGEYKKLGVSAPSVNEWTGRNGGRRNKNATWHGKTSGRTSGRSNTTVKTSGRTSGRSKTTGRTSGKTRSSGKSKRSGRSKSYTPPLTGTADDNLLWPHDRVLKNAASIKRQKVQPKQGLAAILTTGAMNPVHRGHVQMLHQAAARLREAGYGVVGAWLSPSHDSYIGNKTVDDARTFGLPSDFRVELARLAVENDELVSIGTWEVSQAEPSKRTLVAMALQDDLSNLTELAKLQRASGKIRVFYVCGTDHAEITNIYNGLKPKRDLGAVVVPRAGDSPGAENPAKLVYVGNASTGPLAEMSSTKVRDAQRSKNFTFVKEAVGEKAEKFLVDPTPEDYVRYFHVYSRIGVWRGRPKAIKRLRRTRESSSFMSLSPDAKL